MVLTKALILKGVIGATSVVVPASLMIAYRKEISSYFNPSNLTKFDQGLIDYLDNGGDIQFKVIKGSTGTTDLTETDLVFSERDLTISAQIKVSTKNNENIGALTDETNADNQAKKAELQKLNGNGNDNGTAWTWICEIQLTKGEGNENTTAIETNIKDRILKDSDKGLFGILKSQLGNDNKEYKKKIKQDFIRNCAEARGKFAGISPTNEIKTEARTIKINFKKKDDGTELVPENSSEFDKWFPESSANKTTT